MKKKKEGLVERFCMYLGRQNFASEILDYLSRFLFPQSPFGFEMAGAMPMRVLKRENESEIRRRRGLVLMAVPAGTENFHGDAPLVPHDGHTQPALKEIFPWRWLLGPLGFVLHEKEKAAAKHASAACSDPLYKGMHGAPCLFEGGTNNKCPKGTVSGWWWSYEVPGKGRIYYVDCCGGSPKHEVYCNWTNEANWCYGMGRAATKGITEYNCTLAILEADMNVVKVGSGYEVGGADQ